MEKVVMSKSACGSSSGGSHPPKNCHPERSEGTFSKVSRFFKWRKMFRFTQQDRVLLLMMIVFSSNSFSQSKTPLLERNISITIINEKTDAALNKIALQGGFTFSYNPALFDINKVVSLSVTKKTVREILNQLFNNKIEYKTKGNYIILQKAKEESIKPETKNETFTVSGYVSDASGEKVQWVSVYDKKSLTSAITNEYGFYKLNLNKSQPNIQLNVSKQNFNDTIVQLKSNANQFLNISISKIHIDTIIKKENNDSLFAAADESVNSIFISAQNQANTNNIKDTIYSKAQIGLLPFVGTNGKLSGNVINDYSLNVFGGYSLGNRKLELAGFFNVNRGDVGGAQFAGFFNVAGGSVKGAQFAGFTNTIRKDVTGFQGAGFVNLVWGNFEGAQFAGFVNTVRGKSYGAQFAGFVNATLDTVRGFQGAGFVNYSHRFTRGTQLAGFVNVTLNRIEGTQIGCFNYAKEVDGTQIGIFNYAKEIKGVPVGLISYVNNGYHKLEVSADEIFYTNIAFRTGVDVFHNIITAGIRPDDFKNPLWTFGYGIGSTVKLGKTVALDFDLSSNQVVENANMDAMNLINKAYVGTDIKLAHKFSMALGVTVNGQLTKTDYYNYPDIFANLKPHIFYEHTYTSDNLNLKMWMGGKIAFQFL